LNDKLHLCWKGVRRIQHEAITPTTSNQRIGPITAKQRISAGPTNHGISTAKVQIGIGAGKQVDRVIAGCVGQVVIANGRGDEESFPKRRS